MNTNVTVALLTDTQKKTFTHLVRSLGLKEDISRHDELKRSILMGPAAITVFKEKLQKEKDKKDKPKKKKKRAKKKAG